MKSRYAVCCQTVVQLEELEPHLHLEHLELGLSGVVGDL